MKIVCKKCKGEGIVPDMLERVFTIGFTWFLDKIIGSRQGYELCERCNGKGYIKVK